MNTLKKNYYKKYSIHDDHMHDEFQYYKKIFAKSIVFTLLLH